MCAQTRKWTAVHNIRPSMLKPRQTGRTWWMLKEAGELVAVGVSKAKKKKGGVINGCVLHR